MNAAPQVEDWKCTECEGTGMAFPDCDTCSGNGWVEDDKDGGTMSCPRLRRS